MKSATKTNECNCGSACDCKNCTCGPQANFFDTLGNEGRLYLIHHLRDGPKTVSELVQATNIEQTLVSHNLKRLEDCGFVKSERDGKFKRYEMNIELEPLMKLIDKHVQEYCSDKAKACCCAPGTGRHKQ